jgi:hypothetical protein
MKNTFLLGLVLPGTNVLFVMARNEKHICTGARQGLVQMRPFVPGHKSTRYKWGHLYQGQLCSGTNEVGVYMPAPSRPFFLLLSLSRPRSRRHRCLPIHRRPIASRAPRWRLDLPLLCTSLSRPLRPRGSAAARAAPPSPPSPVVPTIPAPSAVRPPPVLYIVDTAVPITACRRRRPLHPHCRCRAPSPLTPQIFSES